ncbi:zinc metalloprotease ZmpB (plasmid) [Paenibacillus polymyxa M1]|uniref:SAF domain-containing protein n=1 Tax=Paenibacillus polymyxa TaxID=1406 RepID=UPI00021BBB5E|nr:SAF domain-containing protein [Paenibacillus polymyxa]CCC86264.1 zinc metalloprotease ZmpB [Paenibacillus polymyxa M1]
MSKVRLRHKQLMIAGVVGAVIMSLIGLVIMILVIRNIQDSYRVDRVKVEQQLQDANKTIQQEMKQVPVVIRKNGVKAGDVLSESDIKTINVPSASVPANIMRKENIVGKYTKIDLPQNTPVTQSMLFEKGVTAADLRNQEFKLIQLPTKLDSRQFVDVRIKFPTGEDYIVLAKKKVSDLAGNVITFQMNEQDILLMSSAIVDAYINDATIYALSYVDPYMQKEAIVTYPPKDSVNKLIKSDPNIVERATEQLESRKRTVLEMNLRSMTEEERAKYNAGAGIGTSGSPADTSNNSGYSSSQPPVKDAIPTNEANSEGAESPTQTITPTGDNDVSNLQPVPQPVTVEPDTQSESKIYGETSQTTVKP